jgi:PII-like signaling protein
MRILRYSANQHRGKADDDSIFFFGEEFPMNIPEEATLLRVFLGESDRHEGKPLYEAIVLKARELHLAGATVLRGVMGFGRSSRLHTAKVLRLSEDLPIVVEIADSEEKIQTVWAGYRALQAH